MSLSKFFADLVPQKHLYKYIHFKKKLGIGSFAQKTYSFDGEDLVLERNLFAGKKSGFYVDVGCYHPMHFSNTHKLHKKGWRGINIDPNPESIALYQKYRPHDINLQLGVAATDESKTYFNFAYSGVNTFDKEYAERKAGRDWQTLISKEEVRCLPLSEILATHLPKGTKIDVLDVDVEGLDLEVLQSNNWETYRPSVILVEDSDFRTQLQHSETFQFLTKQGYVFHAYMNITLIMKEKDFKTSKSE